MKAQEKSQHIAFDYQHTYNSDMQARLFLLLLKPSFLSITATTIIALIVIGGLNWPYFTYNPGLYTFLYGEFGVITALEQSPNSIRQLQDAISTSPILYAAVVLILALVTGRAAFYFVHGLKSTGTFYDSSPEEKHEIIHTFVTRSLIAGAWVLYSVVTFTFIVPFSILLSRIGAESITSSQGIIMNIEAVALFICCLHLHVVFARLFLMRPRVFGSEAVIQDVAFYHKR